MKRKIGRKFDPDVVSLAVDVVERLYEQEKAAIPEPTEEFRSIQMMYQPICEGTNGMPKEYEAFICLNDEKRGTLMPAFYIPVAEKNGRMMDITKYGFDFLFQDMANSKHADRDAPRTFSIRVSADCLTKASFLAYVKKLIRDCSVNPQNLTFEVDAGAINVFDTKLSDSLAAYKELGIKLAIDNYGIDNASLLKLQDIDVDFIKIDRSFIDRIADNKKTYEIVKNIIKMAADLKIDVVAKGVDTTQQKELLLGLKCFYMQGRIFGEPDYLSI
jgi:EAL domain-containing protein (putative c-di-GMP-specific phosphodiesterase class I)